MSSGVPPSREAITAALDQFDAAQANVAALSFQVLSAPEALTVKDRLETVSRQLAHPKTQRRPHRMDSTAASRQWAITGKRLPPPAELPTARPRRRRRRPHCGL